MRGLGALVAGVGARVEAPLEVLLEGTGPRIAIVEATKDAIGVFSRGEADGVRVGRQAEDVVDGEEGHGVVLRRGEEAVHAV